MNNKNTLDCAIVCDLLSLYHDDVVSSTTKTAVESHLEGCESCRGEYKALCAELPLEVRESSTGKRFESVVKRQRLARILSIVLPILLAIAILAAGYLAQLYHPFVDMNTEVEAVQVFRYETDEGTKFFLLFNRPVTRDGVTTSEAYAEYTDDGGAVLHFDFERPVLSIRHAETCSDIFVYDFEGLSGDAPSCDEITEVTLGDTVIWSEAENGDDPVPAYVYEYDRFGMDDHILTWDVDYDENDPSKCTMTAEYNDGRTVIWDFDGNVISVIPAET